MRGIPVNGVDLLAGEAFEKPVLDHEVGARPAFFSRLEDDGHGPSKVAVLRQIERCCERPRRMAVVAAEVRALFDFARPGVVGFVLNGKRVRVAAQSDHGPVLAAFDERNDAVLFNALHAVNGEGREEGLKLFCRAGGIHADFRMAVKIAAEFNNALGILAAEKRFKRAWHQGKAPSRKGNLNFRVLPLSNGP